MKLANVNGRAALVAGAGAIDVANASGGKFSADVQSLYEDWGAFRAFAAELDVSEATPIDESTLGSPAPSPRQVFAIGLNYRSHAAESGMEIPSRARHASPSSRPASRARSTTSSCPARRSTGRSSSSP